MIALVPPASPCTPDYHYTTAGLAAPLPVDARAELRGTGIAGVAFFDADGAEVAVEQTHACFDGDWELDVTCSFWSEPAGGWEPDASYTAVVTMNAWAGLTDSPVPFTTGTHEATPVSGTPALAVEVLAPLAAEDCFDVVQVDGTGVASVESEVTCVEETAPTPEACGCDGRALALSPVVWIGRRRRSRAGPNETTFEQSPSERD
ncbi:MAG: hypothetical protein ACOZNI_00875 [Myxococcota bacterium]